MPTFNQIYDYFKDMSQIKCPDRLKVRYQMNGVPHDSWFPNRYYDEHERIFRNRFGNFEFNLNRTFDMTDMGKTDNTPMTGPSIYVCMHVGHLTWSMHGDVYGLRWREPDEFDNRIPLWPRSNREITEESVVDVVKAFVDTILFPPGRYRDIQIGLGCSKERVMELIRERKEPEKEYITDDVVRRSVRRKYNIEFSDFLEPDMYLRGVLKKIGNRRHRNRTFVEPAPDLSYILSDFDGDIDELEARYWEEMPDYKKGTILV